MKSAKKKRETERQTAKLARVAY